MDAAAAPQVTPPEEREPCPVPLSWRDVLQQFREQREPWSWKFAGATVNGFSLGEGPPIYFLNSLLGDSELFCLTAWVLREQFRCEFFDLPATHIGTESDRLADALCAIADSRGDETLTVFSSGFGGVTALAMMQRYAARLQTAIIQGGFAACRLSLTERVAGRLGSRLPGRLRHIPGGPNIIARNHRPWFPPFDETRWQFARTKLGETPIASVSRGTATLRSFDVTDSLADLSTKTLLIRCEGDSLIQSAAQDVLETNLPNAQVEWLHSSGRFPFLTHPHRVAKLVKAYLAPPQANG